MPGKFQGMTVQEKMKQNNLEQHFTVHRNQVENHTNLTDLADGIIFSFFYFIQECQDTPEKKKKKKNDGVSVLIYALPSQAWQIYFLMSFLVYFLISIL